MPVSRPSRTPSSATSSAMTVPYSDGIKVLRTILRLYTNYRPFNFFSLVAAVLAIISLIFMIPVLNTYFLTGLVPRFPTLIVCAVVLLAALLMFIAGVILSSLLVEEKRNFEFKLQQVHQWKVTHP